MHVWFFNTMDEALEWAEKWILKKAHFQAEEDTARPIEFEKHPFFERVSQEAMSDLRQVIEVDHIDDSLFAPNPKEVTTIERKFQ